MGDKGKGKDKGGAKKASKPSKGPLRPHEQRQADAPTSAPRSWARRNAHKGEFRMTSSVPASATGHLRYTAAPVLERADLGAGVVTQLYRGDAFTVVGREGRVFEGRLADGAR